MSFRGLAIMLLRFFLGALFVYAGVSKIADASGFAGSVAAYRILPYFGNYLAAAILPWIEAVCGALIMAGWRTRGALLLVVLLDLLFMAALVSALFRGLDIDCGCFRHGGARTSAWSALGRDGLLLVAALVVLGSNELRHSLHEQKFRP